MSLCDFTPGSVQQQQDKVSAQGGFGLDIREISSLTRVVSPWHRLLRAVLESPSLQGFKSHVNVAPGDIGTAGGTVRLFQAGQFHDLCGMLGVSSVLLLLLRLLSQINYRSCSSWEGRGGFCSPGPSGAVSPPLLQIPQVSPPVQGPISSSEASVSWQLG